MSLRKLLPGDLTYYDDFKRKDDYSKWFSSNIYLVLSVSEAKTKQVLFKPYHYYTYTCFDSINHIIHEYQLPIIEKDLEFFKII